MTERSLLHLREATIDDAYAVAYLESAITPEDARDGELLAFWWTHGPPDEKATRLLAERDGAAVMYVSAIHQRWKEGEHRFGSIRVRIHPSEWAEERYVDSVEQAEALLVDEGAQTAYTSIREDFNAPILHLNQEMGYEPAKAVVELHKDLAP